MNFERIRTLLVSLPYVVETEQWGGLVFWVGDKRLGGKMFVMLNPEGAGPSVSYAAGEERFHELCEHEGVIPAPYFARIFWISTERYDVFQDRQWEQDLRAAHAITYAKLPPKTRTLLELPKAAQKRLMAERRTVLAQRAAAKNAKP